jgi:sterol carrier protein 2
LYYYFIDNKPHFDDPSLGNGHILICIDQLHDSTTTNMAPKQKAPCYVLGVGMTKFIKPRGKVDYTELGFEAGVKAMLDAQVNYDEIETGIACYCYGDSTCGQRVFYQFGMSQIPIYNVNNNCSTGSTGLHLGRTMIAGGMADAVLVVGFEKMFPGSLQSFFNDRANPTGTSAEMMKATRGITNAPGAPQMFGNAGREYMEKYGAKKEDFAEIARVNHEHSKRNPYSQFQDEYTLEQVLKAPMIHEPLTKLQCCPTSDGGAAAVLVSQAFLDARPHLKEQAIEIAGQCLATDAPSLFSRSSIDLMGFDMTKKAAKIALDEAKVNVKDVKVCELHDCFSANEMIVIDALGLSDPGKAHEMVRAGDITYGGKMVINPSGGLISKGHPLGATGIAQCAELVWHLRGKPSFPYISDQLLTYTIGWANNRLMDGTSAALQHNLGLGGAVVVTVYKRADGKKVAAVSNEDVGKKNGLGYNPAVEAKGFTKAQVDKVRSKNSRSEWAIQDVESKVESRF